MKLGKKLMVALGILSLFVIVSGLVGVLSTAAINAKLDVVTQITSPTVEEVDDMVIALWKINQLMQKFSTESDRESLEELKQEFITDYVFPALCAGALYEGKYPLATALNRPLLAKKMIDNNFEDD